MEKWDGTVDGDLKVEGNRDSLEIGSSWLLNDGHSIRFDQASSPNGKEQGGLR